MKYIFAAGVALVLGSYAQGQQKREDQPPLPEEPLCQFTAKVKWIEMIGKRDVEAIPIGVVDLHWLVGIEILSVEKAYRQFPKKGKEVLLIHSPAMFFRESSRKKILGKQYSFKVLGKLEDGVPRYYGAEVTEEKSPKKKQR